MSRMAEGKRPWVRWYMKEGVYLATQPWMTITCWRVLACLVAGMKTDCSTSITQERIHEWTGIAQPHISEALQVLMREGVVDQQKRGAPYYLCIRYFYKGAETQRPFQHQRERLRQVRKEQAHA